MNTFVGTNSLRDFLNPKNIITPLVELDKNLNPFLKDGIRIFVKLMSHTTLFNIKHVSVYSMLQEQESLDDKEGIVESSSGNTAFSLSILSQYFGFKKTKFFFSHRVPISKLNLIKLLADEIEINKEPLCPDKHDFNSSINKAKNLAKTTKFVNLDQYSNNANPKGHYDITGEQIVQQFKSLNLQVNFLFSAVGTTGTIVGTSSKLKNIFQDIKIIGVASADDITRLGARSKNLLEEVDFNWKQHVDDLIEIDTQSAFINSIKMIKRGLLVGPSTGHIYSGLIKYISEKKLKNFNIVFIACDTFLPYVDEYIKNIPKEMLAKVKNEDLALSYSDIQRKIIGKNYMDFVIKPHDFIKIYKNLPNNSMCIDIRKTNEYKSFRLEKAIKLSLHDIEDNSIDFTSDFKNYENVYLIDCGLSDTAKLACLILRDKGVNSYWVDGGMDYISKNYTEFVIYS